MPSPRSPRSFAPPPPPPPPPPPIELTTSFTPFRQTGTLSDYSAVEMVGEGTYGSVYKARCKKTNSQVALKKLILHKEASGFPLFAVREIRFLRCLKHKNIVELKDIVTSKGKCMCWC